jgi:hypothetical protein
MQNHPFIPDYAGGFVVVLDFFAALRIMKV